MDLSTIVGYDQVAPGGGKGEIRPPDPDLVDIDIEIRDLVGAFAALEAKGIGPATAGKLIRSTPTDQGVAPASPRQCVVATPSNKPISSTLAKEDVVVIAPVEHVGTAASEQTIVTRAGKGDVIATSHPEQVVTCPAGARIGQSVR
jgi:hypothetical protein